MIDKSRPKRSKQETRATLPAFAPVPRQRIRHDGWTVERQRGFIEALADLGSVKAAAHAVNMTPEGAYLLRRHPEADEFRAAWEAALALGVQRLEDVAMDRALNGIEVPVYSYGKLVGSRRVHNDALLMFLLRNRAGERFQADSWQNTDAATRAKLERLKGQWRKEWDAEQRAEQERDADELIESIDARLDQLRERQMRRWSPKTRRLHEQWLASQEADNALPYKDRRDEAEEEE